MSRRKSQQVRSEICSERTGFAGTVHSQSSDAAELLKQNGLSSNRLRTHTIHSLQDKSSMDRVGVFMVFSISHARVEIGVPLWNDPLRIRRLADVVV